MSTQSSAPSAARHIPCGIAQQRSGSLFRHRRARADTQIHLCNHAKFRSPPEHRTRISCQRDRAMLVRARTVCQHIYIYLSGHHHKHPCSYTNNTVRPPFVLLTRRVPFSVLIKWCCDPDKFLNFREVLNIAPPPPLSRTIWRTCDLHTTQPHTHTHTVLSAQQSHRTKRRACVRARCGVHSGESRNAIEWTTDRRAARTYTGEKTQQPHQ